jgi:hypothetical protein
MRRYPKRNAIHSGSDVKTYRSQLLEQLISTSHLQGMERVQILHAISYNVDLLKVLIRLAQETSTITPRQYLALQTHLQEIGKMVGGWLKSVAH